MSRLGGPFAGLPLATVIVAATAFGCAPDAWSEADDVTAIDADGNLVGSDDDTIFKSGYREQPHVFVASFSFRAGLRYSSNGDLIVNDDETGSLVRVDSEGVKHTVLSGLVYPNGIAADLDGWIYITEQGAGRVRRVNPYTGEFSVLTEGRILEPNGITFNRDYSALYIAGFSGVGTIYELPIDADGLPGELREFATTCSGARESADGTPTSSICPMASASWSTRSISALPASLARFPADTRAGGPRPPRQ